jgi:hypothetical protein
MAAVTSSIALYEVWYNCWEFGLQNGENRDLDSAVFPVHPARLDDASVRSEVVHEYPALVGDQCGGEVVARTDVVTGLLGEPLVLLGCRGEGAVMVVGGGE